MVFLVVVVALEKLFILNSGLAKHSVVNLPLAAISVLGHLQQLLLQRFLQVVFLLSPTALIGLLLPMEMFLLGLSL